MRDKYVISALIGLTGAVSNNGKTENTDNVIVKALMNPTSEDIVNLIHREKYIISPDCASCRFPCGNTSDYDIAGFDKLSDDLREVKERVYTALQNKIYEISNTEEDIELPDVIYRAIACIGYDMDVEAYTELIKEIENA